MMPMPQRLPTSVLVRREGRMMMFDAGEGIQLALKKGGLGIQALDAVAISHLHADHVLGLPGILMFRAQNEAPQPLTVIGPPGIARFVRHTLEDLRYHVNFKIEFVEWSSHSEKEAWTWHGVKVLWHELSHSTFCLGYRLEEPVRPGKFYPERARELGVPPGPLFGKLQSGEPVVTPGGETVFPKDVLGPERRGRVMAFATDTRPCPGLSNLVQNADIAFVEGMFAKEHQKEAEEKKHMTAADAAAVAARANAERLILVHISPRYTRDDERQLENEAREHFESALVARPLKAYKVPLPD